MLEEALLHHSRTLSTVETHDCLKIRLYKIQHCHFEKWTMNWHYFTCLKVNNGLSFELVWPSWLDDEARAINGEGDRGHEAGEAGLVGLSHIKLSWCWLLRWVWLWLKLSCLRLCKRLTSSRTLANICSADEKCQIFSFRVLFEESANTKNILPGVSFDETSPNGDCSWHLVGGVVGGIQIGIHLLLLGVRPPGLWTGSNSKLRFNVTQAIFVLFELFLVSHTANARGSWRLLWRKQLNQVWQHNKQLK